ncbi:hypothetical protein ES703_56210 [subsurface metagenome]
MAKRLTGKGVNFKKIVAGVALAAFLSPAQVAYASRSQQKEKASVSIILGARKGFGSSGLYGGELGLKYGRFALVGNLGSRSDINLQDTEEEMFRNVYFQGREDLKDFSSVGASFEYHQPIIKGVSGVIGIGGNLENYARKIEENLVRKIDGKETLLASNTSSVPKKEFVGNIYAGPSFKITKWLELNPNIGYEKAFKKNGLKERGMYVNLRAILSFSRRGNK